MLPPSYINVTSIRYKFSLKQAGGFFFLGLKVLEEAAFKMGDRLTIRPHGEKTYILRKDIFGSKISNTASKNPTYFSKMVFGREIIEALKLPTNETTIVVPHEIHLDKDNPEKNYIVVRF